MTWCLVKHRDNFTFTLSWSRGLLEKLVVTCHYFFCFILFNWVRYLLYVNCVLMFYMLKSGTNG